VVRRARDLGLCGVVRNRPEGTVEIEAEGALEKLRELFEKVREGPPGAIVSRVEDAWSEEAPRHRDFKIGM
jgi:acylphosphatase